MSRATIRIDANTRGAEAGVGRVARKFRQVETNARGAARQAARVAPPAGPGLQQRAAAAGSVIGGRAGGLIGAGAGAAAALGPLGIAAAGVAAALTGLMTSADRAGQALIKERQRAEQFGDALTAARQSGRAAATSALESQRAPLREIAARTGDAGLREAEFLRNRGAQGVNAGLLEIINQRGGIDRQAIDAALAAAETGLIEFGDAAKALAGRRLTGDARTDAAAALQGTTGRRLTPADVEALSARLAATRVGQTTDTVAMNRGEAASVMLDRALSDIGASLQSFADLQNVIEPEMQVRRAINQELERELARKRDLAKAEEDMIFGVREIVFGLKTLGIAFGGEGPARLQMINANNDIGAFRLRNGLGGGQ